MVQVTTTGILLSSTPYGERGQILTAYLADYGMYRGFWQQSTRRALGMLVGSQAAISWKANNEDALGKFRIEITRNLPISIWQHRLKLTIFNAALDSILHNLPERVDVPLVYSFLQLLLEYAEHWTIHQSLAIYIQFKLWLLQELGFGLELDNCAICHQTTNLSYISPKSGKAVSQDCAQPYVAKLLPLPTFIYTLGITNPLHNSAATFTDPATQLLANLQQLQLDRLQLLHGLQLIRHFYQQRLNYTCSLEATLSQHLNE